MLDSLFLVQIANVTRISDVDLEFKLLKTNIKKEQTF